MLSVLFPIIFKFKGQFEKSERKCTKVIFKDYLILLLIILLYIGIDTLIGYLNITAEHIADMWICSCFQIIFYIFLTIMILKSKYYIHNIISMIICCIFSVIIDLILGNLKRIELGSFLSLLDIFVDDLLYCYIKYLMDKKYRSYWNILFFYGLYLFIIKGIFFIIEIIKDPYNNSVFIAIRKAETKYIILNFLLYAIFYEFLQMLLTLLILEYFSLLHVFISHELYIVVVYCLFFFSDYNKYKYHLLFLIPAFFQLLSLLFFLEILEFNFCNLNYNTKRNIMLIQEEEMLLRNDSNTNDIEIEIDKDLIIKNSKEREYLELYELSNDSDEKENYH